MVIQRLLREAGGDGIPDDIASSRRTGYEAQADWTNLESPESYLGYEQGRSFASPEGVALDEPRSYTAPGRLQAQPMGARRRLDDRKARRVLDRPDGRIAFRFHARDVHLVMGPSMRGSSCRFVCSSTASLPARRTAWTSTSGDRER